MLLLVFCGNASLAVPVNTPIQALTVTGTATSNVDGESLPGVNIMVKGTGTGTVTDADGKYRLNVSNENDILVFSSVGYLSEEVPVNGRSVIDVALAEDIRKLDEVVVVGYGTVKRGDLTGAVSSVKSGDMNVGAISSVDQALKGRVAGVQISQTSAEPGGGISIRIRGASSITAGNEPLYVIDGLPINNLVMLQSGGAGYVSGNPNNKNPLNSLNPNDIESIEVLKDASAAAIYGSRGANGVILITTKSGSRERMRVNFGTYAGMQEVYRHIDVLTTEEYINTLNTLALERGTPPVFNDTDIASIGKGTNWQDEIYRKAFVTDNNLSISGGSEKSKYYISSNYFNQEGILKGSGMERYTLRVNLEHDLSNRLTFGLNLNSSFIKDNNNVDGTGINETAGPINAALQYDPTLPPRQPDGSLTISDQLSVNNPLAIIDAVNSTTETNRAFGSLFFNYQLFDNLSAKLNVGADRHIARRDLYNARGTYWGSAGNGQADLRMMERYSQLVGYTMNYTKNWNDKIDLNAVAGVTYEDFINRSFHAGINDFPTDILGTNNLGLGNLENADVGSNKNRNSLLSYLVRANLSLFDKVLLTSSLRADGSSRFGENNKYGYFPSVALAWKLSEEDFIPETIDVLKLRTSWGKTGNQEIGNYASLTTFSLGDYALLGGMATIGTVPSRIANPDLKWETTTQFNIGLDIGFLDERITTSIDYFIKNTEDMLMNLPIPPSSGFGSILSNVGSMKNKGIEVMLSSRNIANRSFEWNTSLAFSSIKNEVTDIGDLEQIATGNIFTSNIGIIKPGLPLNAYYTYKVTGIFQNADQVASSAQPTAQPGNPIYLDANGDGSITAADRVVVGSPWPDFTFGFRNTFLFKGFELDIFIDGQYGVDLLNGNAVESLHPVNERRNRLADQINDRWTPDNPNAKWPSALYPSTYGASNVNSLVIEDASFIRIQSIQLSYHVPVQNINFINNAKIYVTGQNPLLFTDYSGNNPEANAYGRGNVRADYNAYPLSKTWIVGINLGF